VRENENIDFFLVPGIPGLSIHHLQPNIPLIAKHYIMMLHNCVMTDEYWIESGLGWLQGEIKVDSDIIDMQTDIQGTWKVPNNDMFMITILSLQLKFI